MESAMPAQSISFTLACLLIPALTGCTLVQQNQQLNATQGRIDEKTVQLTQAQKEQAALQEQMQTVSAELHEKQVSNKELERRLAKLQAANQQAATDNDAQRARKRKLDAELTQDRAALAALSQNTTMNPAEQQQKIDQLKADIKKRLELLSQIK
jgi:chromosome segregation ATPase